MQIMNIMALNQNLRTNNFFCLKFYFLIMILLLNSNFLRSSENLENYFKNVKGETVKMGVENLWDNPFHVENVKDFIIMENAVSVSEWKRFLVVSKYEFDWNKEIFLEEKWEKKILKDCIKSDNASIIGISWYQAAFYCNWCSERDGLSKYYKFTSAPKDSYPSNYEQKISVRLNKNASGYRLPTSSEWQLAKKSNVIKIYDNTYSEGEWCDDFASVKPFIESLSSYSDMDKMFIESFEEHFWKITRSFKLGLQERRYGNPKIDYPISFRMVKNQKQKKKIRLT